MSRLLLPCLMISLLAATAAHAQMGGGGGAGGGPGGGGGGGGRHGHGGGGAPSGDTGAKSMPAIAVPRAKPANQIEIVGVVQSIAPDTGRVTIAYEAVDELNWPRGTQPFPVAKSALLKDVTVGEKVRFRLESEQIADLKPF